MIKVEKGYMPYGPAAGCCVLRIVVDLSKDIEQDYFVNDLHEALDKASLTAIYEEAISGQNRLMYVQIQGIDDQNLSDYMDSTDAIINAISLESLHKQQLTDYQQKFFADYKVYDMSRMFPVQFLYWGKPFKNPSRALNDFIGEFAIVYLECELDAKTCNEQAFDMAFDFSRPLGNTTVMIARPKTIDEVAELYDSYNKYVDMSNSLMKARVWIEANDADAENKAFAFGFKPFRPLQSEQTLKYYD